MTALQTALGNDISFEDGFAYALRRFASKGDALMIISVSGTSPNLLRVTEVAREIDIPVFSIVGAKGSQQSRLSAHAIIIPSEDYQIVENAQMVLVHWITKVLG